MPEFTYRGLHCRPLEKLFSVQKIFQYILLNGKKSVGKLAIQLWKLSSNLVFVISKQNNDFWFSSFRQLSWPWKTFLAINALKVFRRCLNMTGKYCTYSWNVSGTHTSGSFIHRLLSMDPCPPFLCPFQFLFSMLGSTGISSLLKVYWVYSLTYRTGKGGWAFSGGVSQIHLISFFLGNSTDSLMLSILPAFPTRQDILGHYLATFLNCLDNNKHA